MILWQMIGFIFVGIAGTLLHFLYDWTGGSVAASLFSAVNESIWEHMKLLLYPAVAFSVWEYCKWGKDRRDFWYIKLTGILLGLVLIPTVYYTYTGALGVFWDWFNVTIFFLAAGAMLWLETRLFKSNKMCSGPTWLPVAALVLIGAAFTFFTFFPPAIPLFTPPT